LKPSPNSPSPCDAPVARQSADVAGLPVNATAPWKIAWVLQALTDNFLPVLSARQPDLGYQLGESLEEANRIFADGLASP
jgi:hypothetical protein